MASLPRPSLPTAAATESSIVINPDVTGMTRTEESDTTSSSTDHSRTTTTTTTVTTRTPTRTEVVKTTVSVSKDTAPAGADRNGEGVSPLAPPLVTRTTTRETTVTTGTSTVRNLEQHSTTTAAHNTELSVTSFDVL